MSLADFFALSPSEFQAVWEEWDRLHTQRYRSEWEQTRAICGWTATPHLKKGFSIEQAIPFPWEGRKKEGKPAKRLTPEEWKRLKQRYR